jgi:hypothetical protein
MGAGQSGKGIGGAGPGNLLSAAGGRRRWGQDNQRVTGLSRLREFNLIPMSKYISFALNALSRGAEK